MRVVERRRIRCTDDEGRAYTVIELQEMVPAGSMQDPNAEIAGMKRLMLSDGSPVNFVHEGTYEIVGHPNITIRA